MDIIKSRLVYILIVFSICLGVVAWRTYALGLGKNSKKSNISVIRGSIYDRHGFTLALSEEASTIALAPQEIYDFEQTAEFLAPYLEISSRKILQAIYERKNQHYFYLKRQVDNFIADQIMDLGLLGVHREREYRRHYPGKNLASNLLGFVGRNQITALSGMERNFNKVLSEPSKVENLLKGSGLQLSIDSLFQYHLERELGKAHSQSESKRSAATLMDIKTGAILAMTSLPNFNPNEYWKVNHSKIGNWNIRLNYEPGSTIKIIMAAILLKEKVITPSERFLCKGEIHFHDSTVRCRYGDNIIKHGYLNLSEIIEKSCNVGIIKAMRKIKAQKLYEYMKQLGFGKTTGIFPPGSGETNGYFPDQKVWVVSTSYYMPIGQGFSVTPIQILRASAALVNGNKIIRPYVAWRIRSSQNNKILNEQQNIKREGPFNESINRKIRKMMLNVVRYGTGKKAQVPGLDVLGKTGTGEKSSARGYLNKYVASFIGFFPADKPRYGMIILLDDPAFGHSGGTLAAPVFSRFVQKILPFLKKRSRSILPTRLSSQKSQTHLKAKKDKLYDFRGLATRDAVQILNKIYALKVELKGSGYVYRQEPPPGTATKGLKKVRLYMSGLN